MNYRIPSCLVAALTATALAYAGPADDTKAAGKKLADAANYSWKTTVQNAAGGGGGGGGRGGFGGGPQSGVAEKGGFAVISRETQNGTLQTVLKGEQMVTQTQNGWMTADELRAQFQGGGGGGGGQGRGRGGMGGLTALPAEEVANLLAGATDLKAADGAITGTLNPELASQFSGRGGRGGGGGGGAAASLSGTVKFWIKDGLIAKYEVHITGKMQGRNGEIEVNRTSTTEISNVGSTTVDVPAEAKAKLGG